MSPHLPIVRDDYVRPDICGPCGGKCCKSAPGAAMPEDFGAPDETAMRASLRDRLNSGKWAIDWWDGDPRPDRHDADLAYFVRPATRESNDLFDPSWGGRCIFHSDGCTIFDNRPTGCRGLEPALESSECTPRYASKQDAAVAWLPYAKLLLDVAGELGEVPPEDEPLSFGLYRRAARMAFMEHDDWYLGREEGG